MRIARRGAERAEEALSPRVLLNRIDDVCVFDRLSRTALRGIADIQLKRLGRLLTESRVKLEVTDPARDLITDWGYGTRLRGASAQARDSQAVARPAGGRASSRWIQAR